VSRDDIQLGDDCAEDGFLADSEQVDRAIRRHDRMLVRWLTRKFGDTETARDIAQSAYLRVWRYAQTQTIENPQALIFRTAANLAANEFRARKRMQAIRLDASTVSKEDPIEQIASSAPSPEAAEVVRQEIAASMTAINALPASIRRAFILSRFEDKTYREIAAILGVSESSVEKYIIAALKALRKAVNDRDNPSKIIQLQSRRNRRDRK
jgi:RNA polymerase sigma-70 factor (ECF subfamily)